MNKQSAFINVQSDEKTLKENEEKKELKRKRNRERQRAYYHRHKGLKKKERKKKERKEKVPKSNAERQRQFRQRKAEKSYMDMKRKLESMKTEAISNACKTVGPHDEDDHSCEAINKSTLSLDPVPEEACSAQVHMGKHKENYYKHKKNNGRFKIKQKLEVSIQENKKIKEDAFAVVKPPEPGPSSGVPQFTAASSLHTAYDIPIEEFIIKTEYESDHEEEMNPEEEESAKTNFQHGYVLVESKGGGSGDGANVLPKTAKKQTKDDSSAGAEDPLVILRDRLSNDHSIGDVSTATAKELVELLQTLKKGDSFDDFGRYVASALRSMPARRAQDLQPRIVELLVSGSSWGGGDDH